MRVAGSAEHLVGVVSTTDVLEAVASTPGGRDIVRAVAQGAIAVGA